MFHIAYYLLSAINLVVSWGVIFAMWTKLWAGYPRNFLSIFGRAKRFTFSTNHIQIGHEAQPASYSLGTGRILLLVISWQGCEADHPPLCNAESDIEWNYISTPRYVPSWHAQVTNLPFS
jgi:hypothetical protein